jgi:hypothetical protein
MSWFFNMYDSNMHGERINMSTEYSKRAAHSPIFSSKCRLFRNATFFGFCIIHILHIGCAKI